MEFVNLNGYDVKDKKAIRYYNSVSDMIADTTLKQGMYVKTSGYYTANDGGGAEYHIVTSTDNYSETLNNNLLAEMIINDQVNVKQFGAKGDGETDDTLCIQNAVNTGKKVYFPKSTYAISESIVVNSYKSIFGDFPNSNGTVIKAIAEMDSILELNQPVNSISTSFINGICLNGNNLASKGINAIYLTNGTEIKNIKIEKTTDIGIYLSKAWFCYLSNITIFNTGIGLKIESTVDAVNGVVYDKIFINRCSQNSVYLSGGHSHMFNGCVFESSGETNVLIDNITGAVNFNSCHMEDSTGYSIRVINSTKGTITLVGGNISHNDNTTPIIDVSNIEVLAIYGTHLACYNSSYPDYYVVSLAKKNYFNGEYSGMPSIGTVSFTGYAEGNFGKDWNQSHAGYTHSNIVADSVVLTDREGYGAAVDNLFEMGVKNLSAVDNNSMYRYGFKIDGNSGGNKKLLMFGKKRINNDEIEEVPIFTCDKTGSFKPNRIGTPTTAPSSPSIGEVYFDTTSKKPLWWNGTNWVDGTGTSV